MENVGTIFKTVKLSSTLMFSAKVFVKYRFCLRSTSCSTYITSQLALDSNEPGDYGGPTRQRYGFFGPTSNN